VSLEDCPSPQWGLPRAYRIHVLRLRRQDEFCFVFCLRKFPGGKQYIPQIGLGFPIPGSQINRPVQLRENSRLHSQLHVAMRQLVVSVRVPWVYLDRVLELDFGLAIFPLFKVTHRAFVVLLLPDVGIPRGAAHQKGRDQGESKKD